jgi:hypothetical protein
LLTARHWVTEHAAGPPASTACRALQASAQRGQITGREPVAACWPVAALGYTDVIVCHIADDQGEVLKSYERLAEVRRLVREA